MRYDRNLFLPTPVTSRPAQELPPDRTLSYPFVGFDILQDKYKKVGDENQIGRTEDLYFGTEISGEVGYGNEAFGADRNAVMLVLKALRGIELGAQQQLFLSGDFSSRIEDGRARNLIADAGAKYYWRWRENWLLYVGLSGTVTDALDPELQLLLGGDNGLRGYPASLRVRDLACAVHGRAARFHRLVSVSPGARRRCRVCRRRPHLGQRSRRQQRSGIAEGRGFRICGSAIRAPVSAMYCTSISRSRSTISRASKNSSFWCKPAELLTAAPKV